jgi:HAD superfamily hydrolase (TIGR01509 family)
MHGGLRRPKAMLFDVGNTILDERRFDLEAGLAAVVDRADLERLASEFRADIARHHATQQEPLLAQWVRDRVPRLMSMTVLDVEELIWAEVVTLDPKPRARDVLSRLASDGMPLAAVSNAPFSGRILTKELTRHGLADHLLFVLSSADVQCRKPARPIFVAAISQLGVSPADVWFVGDTLAEDVVGAQDAGLQAIWMSDGAAPRWPEGIPHVRDWDELLVLYDACRLGVMREPHVGSPRHQHDQ